MKKIHTKLEEQKSTKKCREITAILLNTFIEFLREISAGNSGMNLNPGLLTDILSGTHLLQHHN